MILHTDPRAPHYNQKLALFTAADLDPTTAISLSPLDPLPDKVLQYLRIQRLNSKEIDVDRVDATIPITARNELEVLNALIDVIKGLLAEFSITADVLSEQIEQVVYPQGGNAWAAAHVSIGEQSVLDMTLARARALLLHIPIKRH